MYYDDSCFTMQSEVFTDLETAVDSFFYTRGQYGQSKWHSLQFTEKLLKDLITHYGGTYKFVHKLKELSQIVTDLSKLQIDGGLLEEIQCKAEVRYSADIVSREEALKAHHASLAVLRSIVEQLPPSGIFGEINDKNKSI
jgi:HEPN domain-containing protein